MKKLDSTLRVEKAIEFTLANVNQVNAAEFEKFCGVGIVVTPEEIEKVVEQEINAIKPELIEKRYRYNAGPLMQRVRTTLPWADGKAVKNEVDLQVNSIIFIL